MRFAIYSTDNIDPNVAADATFFDLDPEAGEYDPRFDWEARGAHVPTLGGVAHQDYGFNIQDRKISIKGADMLEAVRTPLETKHRKTDTQWNFTDGLEVYRVRFSRKPRGFFAALNVPLYAEGVGLSDKPPALQSTGFGDPPPPAYVRYAYEILLLVVSQLK